MSNDKTSVGLIGLGAMGREGVAPRHHQGAHPLRAAELVRGEGDEVGRRKRELARALGAVGE